MKRLVRIFYDVVVGVSLLLFAAVVVIWLRSFWAAQYLGWSGPRQWWGGLSMAGLIRLEHGTYADTNQGWSHVTYDQKDRGGLWPELRNRDRRGGILKKMGFGSSSIDYNFDGKNMRYSVYLPHWSAAGALAVLPAWRARRVLVRQRAVARARLNCCRKCGYDMRATPQRCPECGTAAAPG